MCLLFMIFLAIFCMFFQFTDLPAIHVEHTALKKQAQSWMKQGDMKIAHKEFVDLVLNGYADLFDVIKYNWYCGWQSHLQFGPTVIKALATFISTKANFVIFFRIFYENALSVLMRAATDEPDSRYSFLVQQVKDTQTFVRLNIFPLVNDARTTNTIFWRVISLAYTINKRRAQSEHTKALRLSWACSDFEFAWRQCTQDPNICSRAFLSLDDEAARNVLPAARTAITSTSRAAQKPVDGILRTQKGNAVICYTDGCNGNHYKKNCPLMKAQKQKRKAVAKQFTTKTARHQMATQARYPGQSLQPQQQHQQQYHQQYQPVIVQQPQHQHSMWQQTGQAAQYPMQFSHGAKQQQYQQQQQPPKKRQKRVSFYIRTQQGLTMRPDAVHEPVCHWFANDSMPLCRYHNDPEKCSYPHFCTICRRTDHNAANCASAPRRMFGGPIV